MACLVDFPRWKQWTAAALISLAGLPALAQPIPLDTSVRTGRLPNGFTYYIRHNSEPQKHVELYLVNKVGSLLETESQRGLAHFMEHMNFNGTRHFPKNELVNYLQKAGVRFGADLNAYTSFDETVYQLPLPTEDPALVSNGLLIMRDWAQEALLDSVEIEKERGVVLEEERLGKGAGERMSRRMYPMLLNHSRYADRIPIGLDSILIHFRPGTIRSFHHDWYRPDLQALIIVGDIDAAAMERQVKKEFSTLKNPANERARPEYTVPLTGRRQFLSITDPENTETSLEIYWKHKESGPLKTEADYQSALKKNLLNSMIAERVYAETNRQENPAFINMQFGSGSLLGGLDALTFSVTAKKGQLQQALTQTMTYVEKIRRYGFTQTELDRVRQAYLRSVEEGLKEKDKTPSVSLVKEYQQLFLKQEASPGIDWESNFARRHIGEITLADISQLLKEYFASKDEDILLTAPETEKQTLPDSAAVTQWLAQIGQAPVKAYVDESAGQSLLPVKPASGKVTSRTTVPELNLTVLTLSNGVKVVLKPTDFKNDEIIFQGYSPGGSSLYNDSDIDAAANASALIGQFGAGNMNPVQLSQLLNGKVLSVNVAINNRTQDIGGGAAPADLETALQLLYLKVTQPRVDTLLYTNIIGRTRAILPNRSADPNNVFSDTVNYVLGDHAYRASPLSLGHIEKIDLQKAYKIYKERFADNSGFTFVFVGNFKLDSITPLLEQYLGALPALHRNEKARDLGIHIPKGKIIKKVYKGAENKATVRIVFSGDYTFGSLANLSLKALSDILQIKVLEHLREDEGEVYSPQVNVTYNKYPQNRYAFMVAFGCAPANADHLIEDVKKEMAVLRDQGPQEEDVQKFKAAYLKELEPLYRQNGFWLSYLLNQYQNDEDILHIRDIQRNLDTITKASLQKAAREYLTGDNEIDFELLPETGSSK
jgi:zinc protease